MTRRQSAWTFSALAFVVVASILGAVVEHYTRRILFAAEGRMGWRPDPAGTRAFLRELEQPTFAQAGADVVRAAKGRDAYLYRYADRAHRAVYGKPFGPSNQGSIGSCVGHGFAAASYVGQSVDWATGGIKDPPLRVSVENIYGGSRTLGRSPPVSFAGFSDGSYGAAAARYISGVKGGLGGILYCQPYDGVDLTTYSIPLCKQWGAYGVPNALAKKANEHTAKAVALCTTWQDAVSALESGMALAVCSTVGFASGDRDADGFCRRQSQWSHCMAAISVKYAKNNGPGSPEPMRDPRDGILILNSWGDYVKGGKHPSDQPDGTFWVTRKDFESIASQGDSWILGSVDGFKPRDLVNDGWMEGR